MTFLEPERDQPEPPKGDLGDLVATLLLAAEGAGIAATRALQSALQHSTGDVLTFSYSHSESTCIRTIEYRVSTQELTVTFQDGNVYDYPSVSQHDVMRFVAAPSKGQFFNAEVRGQW